MLVDLSEVEVERLSEHLGRLIGDAPVPTLQRPGPVVVEKSVLAKLNRAREQADSEFRSVPVSQLVAHADWRCSFDGCEQGLDHIETVRVPVYGPPNGVLVGVDIWKFAECKAGHGTEWLDD